MYHDPSWRDHSSRELIFWRDDAAAPEAWRGMQQLGTDYKRKVPVRGRGGGGDFTKYFVGGGPACDENMDPMGSKDWEK